MTRELLFRVTMADCEQQTFRVSGSGGQHRDKTSSGVRIVHRASGAVGQSSEDRSQHKNRQIAFRRMAESKTFEDWRQTETARLLGQFPQTVAVHVEAAMAPKNLVIEYREAGRWTRQT